MEEKTLYTLIIFSENVAGLLNQITSVFTRRQINIESLNVSASSIEGLHRYTITCFCDKDTIRDRLKRKSVWCAPNASPATTSSSRKRLSSK